MTRSAGRAIREQFAGDPTPVEDLEDGQLALRLDAIRASNGMAFPRPERNQILQEAASRLRQKETK